MDSPDHWERPGAPAPTSDWDQPGAASRSSSRPDWDQPEEPQNGGGGGGGAGHRTGASTRAQCWAA